MARKKAENLEDLSFEALLKELENAAVSLESGALSLEESIELFSRSMSLSKLAGEKIQTAEQTVQQLLEHSNGQVEYKDFTGDED